MSDRNYIIYLTGVAVLVITLFWVVFARAHDPQHHADMTDWAAKLKSKSGALCCDGKDYVLLDGSDWGKKDGHYYVRYRGQELIVPDDAIVGEPNLAGSALLWPTTGYGAPGVRCFMPGVMM